MIRFRRKNKMDREAGVIETLEDKLQELIQFRKDLEDKESQDIDLVEKKQVVQRIIEVTHHIQALREVIGLFTDKE